MTLINTRRHQYAFSLCHTQLFRLPLNTTRAVIKFFPPLQGKAPKEIHAILTETLACFLPGRAKDLSAPLYYYCYYFFYY